MFVSFEIRDYDSVWEKEQFRAKQSFYSPFRMQWNMNQSRVLQNLCNKIPPTSLVLIKLYCCGPGYSSRLESVITGTTGLAFYHKSQL